MADKTLTITVASGNKYPSGTDPHVYYVDGVRPGDFTVTWLADGTLRFDLSDSSNDNHPLVFSTSDSSVLATFRAGIFSTGVVYYLDGVVGYGDWLTPSDFNNATTRYVEITPSSWDGFYWGCYAHGIGMGGIMAMDSSLWGAVAWGYGEWNNQGDDSITLTGQTLTTSLASVTVTAEVKEGWSREDWGWGEYGTSTESIDVAATGLAQTFTITSVTVSAEVNAGWGRSVWGEDGWGIQGDVIPTGQAITTALASVTVTAELNEGWGRQVLGLG